MSNFNEMLEVIRGHSDYSGWFKDRSLLEHSQGVLDEIEEVQIAVKNNDVDNLEEELGDVLWDTMCLIGIAERDYDLDFEKIVCRVVDKFKNRKPHIFEKKFVDADTEVEIWNMAKSQEKGREIVLK